MTKRILVVEDQQDNRTILRTSLRSCRGLKGLAT